jgi:hypothetical protein
MPRTLFAVPLLFPIMTLFLPIATATGQEESTQTPSWDVERESAEELLSAEFPALSDSERVQYTAVGLALVQTINAGDEETYRQLFTDEGWESAIDWWREMFALQKEKFGLIEKAYEPCRGYIRVGKLAYLGEVKDGVTMLVIFEEPKGGALNFRLDESGKITQTDVFIHTSFTASEPEELKPIYALKDSTRESKE